MRFLDWLFLGYTGTLTVGYLWGTVCLYVASCKYFDVGDGAGDTFFRRYDLRKRPWRSWYLHEFFRSDASRCLHDHPWDFTSIILWGGYYEVMTDGRHWRRPGSIIRRKATDAHRIELHPGTRPWSLVIVGEKRRKWGFLTPAGWSAWVQGDKNPICETESR